MFILDYYAREREYISVAHVAYASIALIEEETKARLDLSDIKMSWSHINIILLTLYHIMLLFYNSRLHLIRQRPEAEPSLVQSLAS